jgi:hypothetical protein
VVPASSLLTGNAVSPRGPCSDRETGLVLQHIAARAHTLWGGDTSSSSSDMVGAVGIRRDRGSKRRKSSREGKRDMSRLMVAWSLDVESKWRGRNTTSSLLGPAWDRHRCFPGVLLEVTAESNFRKFARASGGTSCTYTVVQQMPTIAQEPPAVEVTSENSQEPPAELLARTRWYNRCQQWCKSLRRNGGNLARASGGFLPQKMNFNTPKGRSDSNRPANL